MNSAGLKKMLVLYIVSCSLTMIPGCHKETEQVKIKKVIIDVQRAAEERDIKKFMQSLSKAYIDPQGLDYDSVKGLVLGYFFRHQKIHAYIPDLDITVEDASAKAVFQAVLSGGDRTGSASDILPEALGMYSFEVSLRKEDEEWKVTSARWNRVAVDKSVANE